MPWTDKSDPPSRPPARPGGAPNADVPEAGHPETHKPGSNEAGPWGASPGKPTSRRSRPEEERPRRQAAPPAPGLDLQSLAQALRIRVRRLLNRAGGRGIRAVVLGGVIGVAAAWALSGVYEIGPDERAVVTRLGAVEAVMNSGLSYHLPWPLEQAQVVAVERVNRLTLGAAADDGSQALTPTADGQLADVICSVQWRIADPVAYLFHVADPQGALKLSALAAMRQAVGAAPLAAVMSADRAELQRQIGSAIQQRLNGLGAGVVVTGVLIQAVDLPADVQAAAQDVVVARQDARAAIEAAETYRVRILGEARATAAKTLTDAQSYRDQTVQEAQGAAARFEQLDAAYRKAPEVTKDRLYFETLQGVLSRAHTVILDPAKGAEVALPPEWLRASAPRPPPTAPQPSPQAGYASPAQGAKP